MATLGNEGSTMLFLRKNPGDPAWFGTAAWRSKIDLTSGICAEFPRRVNSEFFCAQQGSQREPSGRLSQSQLRYFRLVRHTWPEAFDFTKAADLEPLAHSMLRYECPPG